MTRDEDDPLDEDWEDIIDGLGNRREAVMRLQPHCPACGDKQVQLINWVGQPADWRCRICKHWFKLG